MLAQAKTVLRELFVLTFPWGQDYRLLMVVAICGSLLGGAGLVSLASIVPRLRRWPGWRPGLVLAIVLAQGYVVLVEQRLAFEYGHYLTYSPDDELAMEWLSGHVQPGEVVANDGSADAGIWAPYKAGATILLPRVLPVDQLEAREFIRAHVGQLENTAGAQTAACGLGVRYVYSGAAGTLYEPRQFPSADELSQSSVLEKVFSRGAAAVFRLRCAE